MQHRQQHPQQQQQQQQQQPRAEADDPFRMMARRRLKAAQHQMQMQQQGLFGDDSAAMPPRHSAPVINTEIPPWLYEAHSCLPKAAAAANAPLRRSFSIPNPAAADGWAAAAQNLKANPEFQGVLHDVHHGLEEFDTGRASHKSSTFSPTRVNFSTGMQSQQGSSL